MSLAVWSWFRQRVRTSARVHTPPRRLHVEPLEGRIQLSADAVAADHFADTFGAAQPVALIQPASFGNALAASASVAGAIDGSGDVDFFRFVAPFTGRVTVQMRTDPANALAGALSVFNGSQQPISSGEDRTGAHQLVLQFDVSAGQSYFVRASGNGTGRYDLLLAVTSTDATDPLPRTRPDFLTSQVVARADGPGLLPNAGLLLRRELAPAASAIPLRSASGEFVATRTDPAGTLDPGWNLPANDLIEESEPAYPATAPQPDGDESWKLLGERGRRSWLNPFALFPFLEVQLGWDLPACDRFWQDFGNVLLQSGRSAARALSEAIHLPCVPHPADADKVPGPGGMEQQELPPGEDPPEAVLPDVGRDAPALSASLFFVTSLYQTHGGNGSSDDRARRRERRGNCLV